MRQTIINVSNRLPVTVGEQIKRSSGGLVAALEGMGEERFDLKWLGWPGGEVPDPARRAEHSAHEHRSRRSTNGE